MKVLILRCRETTAIVGRLRSLARAKTRPAGTPNPEIVTEATRV
jgi:hypothetical protein